MIVKLYSFRQLIDTLSCCCTKFAQFLLPRMLKSVCGFVLEQVM